MTTPTVPLRITPPILFGSRRALRLIERNLYVYRHGWLVIVSGFFEPLFHLLSIGFGLGALVGNVPGPGPGLDTDCRVAQLRAAHDEPALRRADVNDRHGVGWQGFDDLEPGQHSASVRRRLG